MPINFSVIKGAALVTIESVLNRWAPGGKRGGNEYVVINSTRSDGKPGSFKINLKSGKWKDFATGDAGLDVVSYVAYIDGVKQTEAAERLAAFLGLNLDKTDPSKPAPSARNGAANTPSPNHRK